MEFADAVHGQSVAKKTASTDDTACNSNTNSQDIAFVVPYAAVCRAIVTADKALLFEPASNNTRKLLDTLVPRLQVRTVTNLVGRRKVTEGVRCSRGGLTDVNLSMELD
jgi:hypothetical protein